MISSSQYCGCPIIPEGPSVVNSPICGQYLFMLLIESYLWGRCDISTPCNRVGSDEPTVEWYDFIVVGAGTAGSIVAGRLSENRHQSVLLFEAGGPEPVAARVPSFYRSYWNYDEVDWMYRTQPGNYCLDQEGKGCVWIRGKVVGGSSVMNGMMYHRGHPADYEHWVAAANSSAWSWEELQPYFDMSEGNKQIGSVVSWQYHSATGKMPVQQFNYQPPEIFEILKAIEQSGLPVIKDMNDLNTPEGFTIAQAFNKDGQRYTTARAYLSSKSKTPNLSVKINAHVTKVLFDGTRAIGVEYLDPEGKTRTVKAVKEVIISAGTLNSPQILMLSGVGPRSELEKFDIPVVADLPVGRNLRNHIGVTNYYLLTSMNNSATLDWNGFTEYMLTRRGPMSSTGLTQVTGLLYSRFGNRARNQPDLQFFINGFYAECSKTGVIGECVTESHGYNVTMNAVALLPKSVGYITLNSTDPRDPPLFFANYFDHPDDMLMVKDALNYLKLLFYAKTDLSRKVSVELDPEYTTVCDKKAEAWSEEWSECMIREHTDPQNHQVGTTAIGSVIDDELRVFNIPNLRVCDAGSMPTLVTGNPQGAIMAVAEKCADLIKTTWK